MKSFFLSGIVFLTSFISLFAQERVSDTIVREGFNPQQTVDRSPYFLSLGLNVLDNGNSKLPFNADEWSFKNPFFINLERRSSSSNFSGILSFSTNKLKIKTVDQFYYSINAGVRYYFDDLIFNNADIEMYAGVGLGRFFLQNRGNNSLNLSGGGRYWFSKNFALSLEGIGKVGLKPMNKDVLSHYAYNLGIVWRSSLRKKTIETPIILEESLLKDKEEVVALKEEVIKDKEEVVAIMESVIKDKEEVVALKEILIKEKEVLVAKTNGEETMPDQSIAVLPETKTDEVLGTTLNPSYPIETPRRLDYTGDWYIRITNSEKTSLIFEHALFSTYATSEDDSRMWISDAKKGPWLQCKITVNLVDGTFTAVAQPNIIDKGTLTITEGRFEKRTGVSKAGNKVDKIYFKAEFSYDPGNILIFEGHKSTGLKEDKY
jgi:hypothetical protein